VRKTGHSPIIRVLLRALGTGGPRDGPVQAYLQSRIPGFILFDTVQNGRARCGRWERREA
jgi:hypothetical protein